MIKFHEFVKVKEFVQQAQQPQNQAQQPVQQNPQMQQKQSAWRNPQNIQKAMLQQINSITDPTARANFVQQLMTKILPQQPTAQQPVT